ncbi:MAG: hypothetical protein EKK33_08965 [Bradyrhizobiaceae bacterium]|nr:MAG: hypothetical protein EKK33_08965 [Bradyrhizobiaceae bacterium]
MANVYTIEKDGHHLDIEANSPDEALAAANNWTAPNPSGKDIAYDVAASGASGLGQGTAQLLGGLGDLGAYAKSGADYLADKAGISPQAYERIKGIGGFAASINPLTAPLALAARNAPTSQDVQRGIESYTGEFHQPTTTPGRYAHAAAAALPSAMLGPEGMAVKLTTGIGSGVGGQALADVFSGTAYEPWARMLGGVIGGAGAAGAGQGVAAARNYGAARDTGREIGRALGTAPVGAGAVRRLSQSAADDALTPQGVAATQARLGPEAMMLDMGRQMGGRAEAVALPLGRAQNQILDAVESRTGEFGAGARQRIGATLDQELGPSRNVVELRDEVHDIVDRFASPQYRRVMEAHPVVWDQQLEQLAQRPAIAEGMQRARGVAANYGEILEDAQPSLRFWDYVKKSMDQRINGMMRTGYDDLSSAQKADLGGLLNAKQALVQHLDRVTGGQYQAARRMAASKPELDEALDFGQSIFGAKQLPEQVAAQINDLSVPARAMAQVGARRELERVLDSTRNDGAKARAFLDTNNNVEKIRLLFGDQAAQAIVNRVGAENTFQNATQTIARNSRTATRQQMIADTETPSPGRVDTTLTGLAVKGAKAGASYVLANGMERTRGDIANVLTARGDQINPIVQALLNYNTTKAANAARPNREYTAAMIRALIGGTPRNPQQDYDTLRPQEARLAAKINANLNSRRQ